MSKNPSNHFNNLFLQRFKGKISSINKQGEFASILPNLPIIKRSKRLLELRDSRRGSFSANKPTLVTNIKAKEVKNDARRGLSISFNEECNPNRVLKESGSWKEHKRVPSDLCGIGKRIIANSWRNNIKYGLICRMSAVEKLDGTGVEVLARTNFQKLIFAKFANSTINRNNSQRKTRITILSNKKANT